jgi:hypothetical protein
MRLGRAAYVKGTLPVSEVVRKSSAWTQDATDDAVASTWSFPPERASRSRNPPRVVRSLRHVGASVIHVAGSVSSCSRSVSVRGRQSILRAPG